MASNSTSTKREKSLVIGLIGLIAVLLFVRSRNSTNSPQAAIDKAFRGTRYEPLIPYLYKLTAFETDNYTSSLFLRANNMTGMGVARYGRRLGQEPWISGSTTCEGSRTCAVYASLYDCAMDLLNWFEYHNDSIEEILQPPMDPLYSFTKYLKSKGYFTADLEVYYNGMKSI